MTVVLALLLLNAVLGAWDTLWYHEYRARLSAKTATTRTELKLHAARDGVYVGLYGFLAFFEPAGLFVVVVVLGLLIEVAVTLADFVIEDRDRPAIGGVAPGERILHSLMAIVYGAMLAALLPRLVTRAEQTTGIVANGVPLWMSVAASAAAFGIAISGARDLLAVRGHDPLWSRRRFAGPSPARPRP